MSRMKTALGVGAALFIGIAVGRTQPPRESRDGFYRASEVIGTSVRAEDGQELGKIRDMLIEERTQQVRYFILGEGDSDLRAVPWGVVIEPQLGPDAPDRFVTVRIEQQKWQQAPTFTWQQIQTGGQATWVTEVDRFYGVSAGGQAGGRAGQDGQARDRQNRDRQQQDRQRQQDQQTRNAQNQDAQNRDARNRDTLNRDAQGRDQGGQGRVGRGQGDAGRGEQPADQQGEGGQNRGPRNESPSQPEQPQPEGEPESPAASPPGGNPPSST